MAKSGTQSAANDLSTRILREWYVPAIHIVVDSNGNELVLDGQQRLAAIRDFVSDKIKVNGSTDPYDQRIAELGGLTYSQLPPATQRAVRRFVIPVITLSDFLPQEPNELFFRLNQSYNLTPPEKRNALHGEARNQVKELVNDLTDGGLLNRERIGFSNGRLAYDDIIARTCVAVEVANLRRHINNNVVEEYYRSGAFTSDTIAGVHRAGLTLLLQIEDAPSRIKFNKGTLQTWLVYCFWAPEVTGDLPESLLARFESERTFLKSGEGETVLPEHRRLLEVVGLYEDRASYRVTDVSSVLARDVAIHLFSSFFFNTPGSRGSAELLREISHGSSRSTQSLIFDFLEESDWGNPLVLHGPVS